MNGQARDALALQLAQIASTAGRVIAEVRRTAPKVSYKPDHSPVTNADRDSEHIIREGLAHLMPGVPVIAEESFDGAGPTSLPSIFVLVDPLDGTREFVAGRDEFTVNIAVIDDGVPIVGCVYAPAMDRMFFAGAKTLYANVAPGDAVPAPDTLVTVTTSAYPPEGLRAVMSRSHLDAESHTLLDRLHVASQTPVGSSYKFCLIAEGWADVYPRLAPIMEWDTAAGHAVLTAAGGRVIARDGAPLRYGNIPSGFRHNGFVAWGREPVTAG